MEIKEIAIGGIDRHSPAQDAPPGVCEELINVRSDALGLHVYREGVAISGDLDLEKIFLHRWGGRVYYVGIDPQSRVVRFSLDGTTEQTLQWVSSAGNTDIKSIGNMLVISDKGEGGQNPSTRTWVLEETDGAVTYKPLDSGELPLPSISREDVLVKPFSQTGNIYNSVIIRTDPEPEQDVRTPARSTYPFIHYVGDTVEWVAFREGLKDTLRASLNRISALEKHVSYGIVLIGTSVTLYDGTETAFGNLLAVDLSPRTPYRDAGNLPTVWQLRRSGDHTTKVLPMKDSLDGLFINWVNKDMKAYFDLFPDGGDLGGTSQVSSFFSSLCPKVTIGEGAEDMKDYIKGVSLWVSRPYDKIDWDTFDVKIGSVTDAGAETIFTPAEVTAGSAIWSLLDKDKNFLYPMAHIRRMSECKDGLHKQLLFRQKEWTLDEILEKGGSVMWECEFGTSEGTLGDTLTVDAWNSKRAGTMFVYNNRIHMFDSCVKVDVQDRELEELSGWDDEWYLSQSISDTESGDYWHMKYTDNYPSREEEHGMRDITLEEASRVDSGSWPVWTWQTVTARKALGLYYDATPTASESASSYTWYSCYPRPKESSKYAFALFQIGTGLHEVQYVYLSTDRQTLTHDAGRAKYMALSTENSANHPENLPWKNVPSGSWEEATLRKYRDCTVIAYLKAEGRTLVLRHEGVPVLFRYTLSGSGEATMGNVANLSGFLAYPDSRCERLVIQYSEGGSTYGWETPMKSEGSAYNYAYAYVTEGSAEFSAQSANTDQTRDVYEESDIVNVSALNNPTVFPVEQSYRFVGSVTGMALALEELKSTQQGTYPVYVMTERGVFAMNQGTGGVLYASITPINTDKCVKGKSVQVRNGVAYYANGRLYWLVGRKRVDIMLPLDGYPDYAPRANRSYPLACQGSLYDVTALLSNGGLRQYLDGSSLGYDSFHDELMVSNPSYAYTYVFNFGAQRWFKIQGVFSGTEDHQVTLKSSGGELIPAQRAKGRISVGLLAVERGARIIYNRVATTPAPLDLGSRYTAGSTLTLRMNGQTVAGLTLKAPATLPAAMSLLTANLSWIESDTVTSGGSLYGRYYIYSQAEVTSLVLGDGVTDVTFSLASSTGTVTTTDKLIGATATLSLEDGNGTSHPLGSATLDGSSTVGSLCRWIAGRINASSEPFSASVSGNDVNIEASWPGVIYNNWLPVLTISDTLDRNIAQTAYASIAAEATSGGTESGQVSPAGGSVRILDLSTEEEEGDRLIHIQTRPLKLTPMAFGVVQRMIARVRATLAGSQSLSVYAFTSDDLERYACSAAEQRKDCTIDRIRLERTAHGRKYTVLVIGGTVPVDTELSTILCQVKTNAPKKMR